MSRNARIAAAAGDVEMVGLDESKPCLISGNLSQSGTNPPAGLGTGVGVDAGDMGAEAGDEVGDDDDGVRENFCKLSETPDSL